MRTVVLSYLRRPHSSLTSAWIQFVRRTDDTSLGSRSTLLAAMTIGFFPAICLRLESNDPFKSKTSTMQSTTALVSLIPSGVVVMKIVDRGKC